MIFLRFLPCFVRFSILKFFTFQDLLLAGNHILGRRRFVGKFD